MNGNMVNTNHGKLFKSAQTLIIKDLWESWESTEISRQERKPLALVEF